MYPEQAAPQSRQAGQMLRGAVAADAPESIVSRAVTNLQTEINGLSVNLDMLCQRIGVASRPTTLRETKSGEAMAEPMTSLLTTKIDDQAKRVRMLSNQVATALEGLEL